MSHRHTKAVAVSSALEMGLTEEETFDLLPNGLQICPEQRCPCPGVGEVKEPIVPPQQRCFHGKFQRVSDKSDRLSAIAGLCSFI